MTKCPVCQDFMTEERGLEYQLAWVKLHYYVHKLEDIADREEK